MIAWPFRHIEPQAALACVTYPHHANLHMIQRNPTVLVPLNPERPNAAAFARQHHVQNCRELQIGMPGILGGDAAEKYTKHL